MLKVFFSSVVQSITGQKILISYKFKVKKLCLIMVFLHYNCIIKN